MTGPLSYLPCIPALLSRCNCPENNRDPQQQSHGDGLVPHHIIFYPSIIYPLPQLAQFYHWTVCPSIPTAHVPASSLACHRASLLSQPWKVSSELSSSSLVMHHKSVFLSRWSVHCTVITYTHLHGHNKTRFFQPKCNVFFWACFWSFYLLRNL